MIVMTGTRREITMRLWNEQLEKAEKRLADSMRYNMIYGGNEEWVELDAKRVNETKAGMDKAVAFMDANNIK